MKLITVKYQFKHKNFGFENSVTVLAENYTDAISKAEKAVISTYGQSRFKYFTLSIKN